MGYLDICGLHHMKIIGSFNTDQLYYDDYYCKVKRGCYLTQTKKEIDALFIVNDNKNNEIYKIKSGWFDFIDK